MGPVCTAQPITVRPRRQEGGADDRRLTPTPYGGDPSHTASPVTPITPEHPGRLIRRSSATAPPACRGPCQIHGHTEDGPGGRLPLSLERRRSGNDLTLEVAVDTRCCDGPGMPLTPTAPPAPGMRAIGWVA